RGPVPGAQPAVARGDPPRDVHGQHHRGVGDVLVQHRRGRHDDAAFPRGREVGALEPDPVEGDDLQLRQRVHHRGREPDHGERQRAADASGRGPQRAGDVVDRRDLVQGELGAERLQHSGTMPTYDRALHTVTTALDYTLTLWTSSTTTHTVRVLASPS